MNQKNHIELTQKQQTARRKRNVAIGLVCAFLVVVFYVVTLAKFAG